MANFKLINSQGASNVQWGIISGGGVSSFGLVQSMEITSRYNTIKHYWDAESKPLFSLGIEAVYEINAIVVIDDLDNSKNFLNKIDNDSSVSTATIDEFDYTFTVTDVAILEENKQFSIIKLRGFTKE